MPNKARKVSCCKRCGNPSRGHVGPQGSKCEMSSVVEKYDAESGVMSPATKTDKKDRGSPSERTGLLAHEPTKRYVKRDLVRDRSGSSDHGQGPAARPTDAIIAARPDPVMLELVNQVGKLSLTMQSFSIELNSVKERQNVAVASAASFPRVTGEQYSLASTDRPAVRDLAAAEPNSKSEEVVCLPSGAKVTPKILRAARNGEFINLSDFAPVLEPSNMTETSIVEGELVFKPKRTLKSIDSFLLWSMAWAAYEGVLIEADPKRYAKMSAYRLFIQTCAAKYWWSAVYSYDVKNRAMKSMSHSLEFQVLDSDLYVSTLDVSTTKTNVRQCARCRSIWHTIQECPFPEECSVAPNSRSSSQTPAQKHPSGNRPDARRGSQVCFNFNAGRCVNPCSTGRRHVCERCGGPEPLPRCRNCNQGTGGGGNNNNMVTNNASHGSNYPVQQNRMG
jgi:hypothetical protein